MLQDRREVGTGRRLLLLPRYSRDGASSRQRFFQFLPDLERAGFACTVSPFFGPHHVKWRFGTERWRHVPNVASCYLRRLRVLRASRRFDLVFVQMEFLPWVPWVLERLGIPRHVPYVCDYDDAWFYRYDGHHNPMVRVALGRKIGRIVAAARGVTVGSEFLASFARRFNDAVDWLPTSIDLDLYPEVPPSRPIDQPFTIGWIGSPSTACYLASLLPTLRAFCEQRRAKVVIIGAGPMGLQDPCFSQVPWAESTEVKELSRIDVGIMPVPDLPFSRGKCAFKLIQYMGCWKPVIASPVGENTRVVRHGVNGFLAESDSEWTQALERLFASPDLARAMGREGRMRVAASYSRRGAAARLVDVLEGALRH